MFATAVFGRKFLLKPSGCLCTPSVYKYISSRRPSMALYTFALYFIKNYHQNNQKTLLGIIWITNHRISPLVELFSTQLLGYNPSHNQSIATYAMCFLLMYFFVQLNLFSWSFFLFVFLYNCLWKRHSNKIISSVY